MNVLALIHQSTSSTIFFWWCSTTVGLNWDSSGIDPQDRPFWVETHLPSPKAGSMLVYCRLWWTYAMWIYDKNDGKAMILRRYVCVYIYRRSYEQYIIVYTYIYIIIYKLYIPSVMTLSETTLLGKSYQHIIFNWKNMHPPILSSHRSSLWMGLPAWKSGCPARYISWFLIIFLLKLQAIPFLGKPML